jgi:acyl carrier protein phosphodiesterase
LVSYRDISIVETVLIRIGERIKRPNPLAMGFSQLQRNYDQLEADCDQFLIQAQEFLREEKRCHSVQDDRK